MSLLAAHKGYEYQDLFTAFHITEMFLKDHNAFFMIDKKESLNDKFDDFTITTDTSIIKKQIKYSEKKVFEKADLSSTKYDLSLDVLFKSWKELPKDKSIDIRICLAWEYIEDSQDLDFLIKAEADNYYGGSVDLLKIDLERIWPLGKEPLTSWRRLRKKAETINREEFEKFVSDLSIEVNLPKFSGNFSSSEDLESLVLENLKKFGIGKYPNDHKNTEDVAMNLLYQIKNIRANGSTVTSSELIHRLRLKNNYGNITQEFKIDNNVNLNRLNKIKKFDMFLKENKKVLLLGQPGSGKSWFIQNFKIYLEEKKIKVIQHYCFTNVNDLHDKERITVNAFMGNLIYDIIKVFPELKIDKKSKYGVDFEELQLLINEITEEVVLIVDGLDHIGRIHSFHKDIMGTIDIKIIDMISRLEFPENIKIVIGSQPIDDVVNLNQNNYRQYYIEGWNIKDIKGLIIKYGLTDTIFEENISLSELLLEKSLGNPLYLTYLLNEIKQKKRKLTIDTIRSFPSYNSNLENYYEYLMIELPENQKVPQILAGAPFSLTEENLKEITGLGNYVSESIKVFRSVLTYSSSSGGYAVYHESFRRYILERLENNEVSLNKAVFSELISWLETKGFYENRKSYLNLFILLFESKRYADILKYCNKEFVIDSLSNGNNIESIKNNFTILMKSAAVEKDYKYILISSEISNMIYSLEFSFEENSEAYYLALGETLGFDILQNTLMYDGKMALELNEGLKVCYICSKNHVIPEWKEYIKTLINLNNKTTRKTEEEYLTDYKYLICASLDNGKDMTNILESIKLNSERNSRRREIVIEEFDNRDELDKLFENVKLLDSPKHWIGSMNDYNDSFEFSIEYVREVLAKLNDINEHSRDDVEAVTFYVSKIRWIIVNHSTLLTEFEETIKNRNWFYNWLLYVYKVNKAVIELEKNNGFDEKKLIEAYVWLTKDTEQFKGKPRTCDLYKFQNLIYDSVISPLKYIKNNFTWNEILETISDMSSRTMSSLNGATVGPLPTYSLLDMLVEVSNNLNGDMVIKLFKRIIQKESNYRYYSYLADYSFKYAVLLSKYGEEMKAKDEFRKGVEYLLSYSFRKDRTLSRLIDSLETIHSADSELGLDRILKVKQLADSVIYHTDGRDTSNYPIEWFEILAKASNDVAITYLGNELIQTENYWVLENSLDTLLEIMASEVDPLLENVLYRTRPNVTSQVFINSYLLNIKKLIALSEITIAKLSIKELLNRFPEGIDDDRFKDLSTICSNLGITYNSILKEKMEEEEINFTSKNEVIKHKKKAFKDIKTFSYDEFIDFIKNEEVDQSYISEVILYLQLISELDGEAKRFLKELIKYMYGYKCRRNTKEVLISALEEFTSKNDIMSYLYITMFLEYKDGWGKRLTHFDYFVKAIEYSKEIAETTFFDYFYSELNLISYDSAVGDSLIIALSKAKLEVELLIEYWDSLFEIINFRLSGQKSFNIEKIKEQSKKYDTKVRLMYLIISRLKYGEGNRYKWIISFFDQILDKNEYKIIFLNAVKLFIKEKNSFIDYVTIIILYFIREKFTKVELEDNGILKILFQLYSETNSLINYLINEITQKKIIVSNSNYNNDCSEYSLEEKKFADILCESDNRLMLLSEFIVDKNQVSRRFLQEIKSDFFQNIVKDIIFDREYKSIISNVYFYDLLTNNLANEIEFSLKEEQFFGYSEKYLYEILLSDTKYIIANNNSLNTRPMYLTKPNDIKNSIESVAQSEWITISHYEKWYDKRRKYNTEENFFEPITVLSILSFLDNSFESNFPLLFNPNNNDLFDSKTEEKVIVDENSAFIVTNLCIDEEIYLNFKVNDYFYIRPDILDKLSIKMKDSGEGIVGINEEQEVVIQFSKWEVCFDDPQTDSSRVPYLVGSELKMRQDKFEELCGIYGKEPKRITKKFSR